MQQMRNKDSFWRYNPLLLSLLMPMALVNPFLTAGLTNLMVYSRVGLTKYSNYKLARLEIVGRPQSPRREEGFHDIPLP
jgi:hypothetical protein